MPAFQQLEEPHRRFHEIVREIYQLVCAGRQQEAEAAFSSLEDISTLVLQKLDDLAKSIR
ncbi:CZB domain-containing protein [Brevibacillus nitrificans]|uniref:CZB domain-containing protein n=1 Tax=Brevibacillus nitrificans TaxID=651560 RepID=UPI0028601561|nr:CZB domain-containing protein [Brevibacillus nitrificans]MDR7314505.1 hypothetical protein [Brevibacillus nitrificans]